ncbi:helix-turn-helix domain-containing protein [Pseudahrensia aquimaris]|uniref:Helix-turn-helix domain-containing protein n=1 Tax=Pseudahrensia aquimaris TaxID=744461 RepID=A0ABW3FBR0_9HYPH
MTKTALQKRAIPQPVRSRTARIYQIKSSRELTRDTPPKSAPYRDSVCALCEKMVALHLDVSLGALRAPTRRNADIALARQIAMYLAHTTFSLPLTEVGIYFKRDRTTVTHACAVVENRRDSMSFEVTVSQLESLLIEVRSAVETAVLDKNGAINFPSETI